MCVCVCWHQLVSLAYFVNFTFVHWRIRHSDTIITFAKSARRVLLRPVNRFRHDNIISGHTSGKQQISTPPQRLPVRVELIFSLRTETDEKTQEQYREETERVKEFTRE